MSDATGGEQPAARRGSVAERIAALQKSGGGGGVPLPLPISPRPMGSPIARNKPVTPQSSEPRAAPPAAPSPTAGGPSPTATPIGASTSSGPRLPPRAGVSPGQPPRPPVPGVLSRSVSAPAGAQDDVRTPVKDASAGAAATPPSTGGSIKDRIAALNRANSNSSIGSSGAGSGGRQPSPGLAARMAKLGGATGGIPMPMLSPGGSPPLAVLKARAATRGDSASDSSPSEAPEKAASGGAGGAASEAASGADDSGSGELTHVTLDRPSLKGHRRKRSKAKRSLDLLAVRSLADEI